MNLTDRKKRAPSTPPQSSNHPNGIDVHHFSWPKYGIAGLTQETVPAQ